MAKKRKKGTPLFCGLWLPQGTLVQLAWGAEQGLGIHALDPFLQGCLGRNILQPVLLQFMILYT